MRRDGDAKYLVGLRLVPAAVTGEAYPFNLSAVRTLDLHFRRPVTFFVGENGTGKSTVASMAIAYAPSRSRTRRTFRSRRAS
jgi:predicted ATPase